MISENNNLIWKHTWILHGTDYEIFVHLNDRIESVKEHCPGAVAKLSQSAKPVLSSCSGVARHLPLDVKKGAVAETPLRHTCHLNKQSTSEVNKQIWGRGGHKWPVLQPRWTLKCGWRLTGRGSEGKREAVRASQERKGGKPRWHHRKAEAKESTV
jgi:hypothetical protein